MTDPNLASTAGNIVVPFGKGGKSSARSCVRRFRSLLQKLALAAQCARIRRFTGRFVLDMIEKEEARAGSRVVMAMQEDKAHRPGHKGKYGRRASATFAGLEDKLLTTKATHEDGFKDTPPSQTSRGGTDSIPNTADGISQEDLLQTGDTGMRETWREMTKLTKQGALPLLVWAPQKEDASEKSHHKSSPNDAAYMDLLGPSEQYCFCHLEMQRYLAAVEMMTVLQRNHGASRRTRLLQTARELSQQILPDGVESMLLDNSMWWHGVLQLVCEQADKDGPFKVLVDLWLPTVSTSLVAPGVPLSAPAQPRPTPGGLDYTTPAAVALGLSNTGGALGGSYGGTNLELGGSAATFSQAGGKGGRSTAGMGGDAQLVLVLGGAQDKLVDDSAIVEKKFQPSAALATSGGVAVSVLTTQEMDEETDKFEDAVVLEEEALEEHVHSGLRTLFMLPPFHSQCRNSLNLASTQLMVLPSEVGGLGSWGMRRLDLCNNTIPRLPASIHQLKRLTILLMHNNKLQSLPTELGRLKVCGVPY